MNDVRPEPVEAYRLCDLPPGTKYMDGDDGLYTVPPGGYRVNRWLVKVVEWPQRTYDGIPADDLDALLEWAALRGLNAQVLAVARIRAALAAQEQD